MGARVLVTGGVGFIGSRLVARLLENGYVLRVLDNLLPHVHGLPTQIPKWMARECDVRVADIADMAALAEALRDVDIVVHLAAETGTGQSMYEVRRHVSTNVLGMATLVELLVRQPGSVRKLVLASSRAVYGEGKYVCSRCGPVYPSGRDEQRLARRAWDPVCMVCGSEIAPVPTDEESRCTPTSVYGTTKLTQEHLALTLSRTVGVSTIILRYQNVYGAGQSLRNPYTGILTTFWARARSSVPPRVFEDGKESRDFIHVSDAVEATVLALERCADPLTVLNVGSGRPVTILQVAEAIVAALGVGLAPLVTAQYRAGDVRHCCADIGRIARMLGFAPRVSLAAGIAEFTSWALEAATPGVSGGDMAEQELGRYGLLRTVGNE